MFLQLEIPSYQERTWSLAISEGATRLISQLSNPSIQAKHLGELGMNYLSLCQLRSDVIDKDEFMKILEGQESQNQANEAAVSLFHVLLIVFVSQDRDSR